VSHPRGPWSFPAQFGRWAYSAGVVLRPPCHVVLTSYGRLSVADGASPKSLSQAASLTSVEAVGKRDISSHNQSHFN